VDLSLVAQKLAIAVGLGLLVGLQRERVRSPVAGIRTFALITVLGTICALLASPFGGWIVGVGAVAVAAMLVVGNMALRRTRPSDPGMTTEVAALLMYGVGAYLVVGHAAIAVAVGGGVAVLLHWKAPLHQFVARIGETDVTGIMRFVLVALVIYPVLPDQAYGPYQVLNPQQIWQMVVLIVGISLGGYVAYKLLGQRAGAVAAGILGGLVSSTATTVSYARHTRQAETGLGLAATVVVIASAMAYARILTEIAVVAPSVFWQMAPPLAAMLVAMAAIAAAMFFLARGQSAETLSQENPAELLPAMIFAVLFALVTLGTEAARDYLGAGGMYGVALLSGLHDVDAITLSTARFVRQQKFDANTGWRLILAASLSNVAMKGVLAAALGQRRLFWWVAAPFAAALAVGLAIMAFWPHGG
jgi:uncharacterized membrane protein (DUF4010 family)